MVKFDNRSSVSTNSRRRPSPRRPGSVYSSNHPRHTAPSLMGLPSAGGSSVGDRKSPSVHSSASSRRARPRRGFVHRMVRYIKKLFRDIHRWVRRHPIKVFVMVIIPLIVSGVLQKLLSMIGIRLPRKILGRLAGPAPGEGLRDHWVGMIRLGKAVV